MKKCSAEMSPDCPGHEWWERLSDCLTVALHATTDDGSTGNVDGFGLHVRLFIQETTETIDGCAYPDTVKVTIPAGTYRLLIEDDQGHVTVLDYDTAERAQAAFDLWEERYSAYLDAEEMRELNIVSSTGRIGA